MILDRIQAHLEAIYGLDCSLKAKDFLLGEEQLRSVGRTPRSREELLVHESDDGLDVGLFLHPDVLDEIEPCDGLPSERQLPAYCEAAEGVSHFLYLQHTAESDRRVSLLELEAQAEIDKFAACTLLSWKNVPSPTEWIHRLFERIRYADGLAAEERWRYEEANRLAKAYCKKLVPLIVARRLDRLLAELRHSYRLGAEAKLAYLGR